MRFVPVLALLCLISPNESEATVRCRTRTCHLQRRVVVKKVVNRRRVIVRDQVQTIVIAPQVILQDVQRDQYYSVGDQQYQELLIQAAMARLMMYGGGRLPPQGSGIQEATPPAQRFTPKAAPVAGLYQEAKLVAVVSESCVKCHNAGSPNGTLMVGGKLADISEPFAWKSLGLVYGGDMPKAAEALKDEKVQLFYDWAKAQKGKR